MTDINIHLMFGILYIGMVFGVAIAIEDGKESRLTRWIGTFWLVTAVALPFVLGIFAGIEMCQGGAP